MLAASHGNKVCDPQNGRTACQHEGTMNCTQLALAFPKCHQWATHAQPVIQQRAIRADATGSPGVGESFGNVQTEEP